MHKSHEMNHRLWEHERLVELLDTMAIMLNCTQTLNSYLPDATRPDVLRVNTTSDLLFMGDAKNSESPSSSFTQERLFNYIQWLALFLSTNNNGRAMFAICQNRGEESHAWLKTLFSLFARSHIYLEKYGVEEFDASTYVVWIQAKHC